MNYYKQFAAMLGLELDEDFKLINRSGTKIDEATYRITEDGIYSAGSPNAALWGKETTKLDYLLSGDVKVLHKPFKPKDREDYYFYSNSVNAVLGTTWTESVTDYSFWKTGNCFRTRIEASKKGKEIMEQIMKEYKEE